MTEPLMPADFGGLRATPIAYDGDWWVTGEAIGLALEYPDPVKSIGQIFKRHRTELEPCSALLVVAAERSPGDEVQPRGRRIQGRQVRAYNKEGLMLLTALSRQPKAVEFRKWTASVYVEARNLRRQMSKLPAPGERDRLLELCLIESGRGNLAAFHVLINRYGYSEALIDEQIEQLQKLKAPRGKPAPLPV